MNEFITLPGPTGDFLINIYEIASVVRDFKLNTIIHLKNGDMLQTDSLPSEVHDLMLKKEAQIYYAGLKAADYEGY